MEVEEENNFPHEPPDNVDEVSIPSLIGGLLITLVVRWLPVLIWVLIPGVLSELDVKERNADGHSHEARYVHHQLGFLEQDLGREGLVQVRAQVEDLESEIHQEDHRGEVSDWHNRVDLEVGHEASDEGRDGDQEAGFSH